VFPQSLAAVLVQRKISFCNDASESEFHSICFAIHHQFVLLFCRVMNGAPRLSQTQPHMHAHPSMELMPQMQPPQLMHAGANGIANGAAMTHPPGMHSAGRAMMMSQQYAAPSMNAVGAAAGGHSAPSSARGSKGMAGCSSVLLYGVRCTVLCKGSAESSRPEVMTHAPCTQLTISGITYMTR
jgi:hypothetical protein